MHEGIDTLPDIRLGDLHALTREFAFYEEKDDPLGILRRGLIEEAVECVQELAHDGPIDKDRLSGELGDILWYVSETLRHLGFAINDPKEDEQLTLDSFQQGIEVSERALPIWNDTGQVISPRTQPQEALAVSTLRLMRHMDPGIVDVWLEWAGRPAIVQAAREVLACVGIIASDNDIRLADAAHDMVQRLRTRQRRCHLIEEAAPGVVAAPSRQRVITDPRIVSLFVNQAIAEQ